MNNGIKIRDEELLLIGLCRLEFSDEHIKKIRVLAESISDWKYFSLLANAHGVAALVYHNLKLLDFLPLLPDEPADFLRGTLMRNLSRNSFNTGTLAAALNLFNKEKIKTVLLKGFALEITVYGNAGLRQMSDIDVLIRRDQCLDARDILLDKGYSILPVKSFFHKFILLDAGKHLPTLLKNGTAIEIHHELFGNKKGLTGMFFDNSYEVEVKGQKAYIAQPLIFFLYLIRHLWLHEMNNESQLRLYTDLVVMIEKYPEEIFNYDLLTYAGDAGLSKVLAWHLEPLRDFWGITFPQWINDFIDRWHEPGSSERFIFFLKSPKNNPPLDKARTYRHMLGEIPGFRSKVLYILGDLFPSLSFMKKRYGCSGTLKAISYYPHRVGKILWLIT
jgi:hypothetical protein